MSPLTEDMFLIQNLLATYCHAVDRGTLDEVAALFHPDAIMTPSYEGGAPVIGRDAIRGWYENYNTYYRSDQVQYLRHQITTPSIHVNGTEATSVCYFDADVVDVKKNESVRVYGRYDDKLVREGDNWLFMAREIHGYYAYPITNYQMMEG